jgi:hypothetical protein
VLGVTSSDIPTPVHQPDHELIILYHSPADYPKHNSGSMVVDLAAQFVDFLLNVEMSSILLLKLSDGHPTVINEIVPFFF